MRLCRAGRLLWLSRREVLGGGAAGVRLFHGAGLVRVSGQR